MTDVPLRTVHVDTERTWGGGQRQVAWLVAGLAARGHPTWLLARRASRFFRSTPSPVAPVLPLDPVLEWDPLAAVRIRRIAALVRADLVVAHAAHAAALVALASVGTSRPFIVTRRVALPLSGSAPSRWKHNSATAVVAVSNRVRDVLVASEVAWDRIMVVRSGVDLSRPGSPAPPAELRALGLDPERPIAVMVSALTPPHKDPLTFVAALAAARRRRPDLQGLLVGDGPLASVVREAIAHSGLSAGLRMAGHREDAESLVAAGTLAVLTSRDEGLGTTLLDAMLWGIPVVATRAGGVAEVVRDGVDGILAPIGDAEGVADGMLRILGDATLRSAVVASARERVAGFSSEAMVEGSIAAYRRAVYSGRC